MFFSLFLISPSFAFLSFFFVFSFFITSIPFVFSSFLTPPPPSHVRRPRNPHISLLPSSHYPSPSPSQQTTYHQDTKQKPKNEKPTRPAPVFTQHLFNRHRSFACVLRKRRACATTARVGGHGGHLRERKTNKQASKQTRTKRWHQKKSGREKVFSSLERNDRRFGIRP